MSSSGNLYSGSEEERRFSCAWPYKPGGRHGVGGPLLSELASGDMGRNEYVDADGLVLVLATEEGP